MDIIVFPGGRQIPNADRFPETLTPFPEPTDFTYALPPEDPNRRPVSPPQKLRPIRCSVRSPSSVPEGDRVQVGSGSLQAGWDTNSLDSESRFFSDLSLPSGDGDDHSAAKLEEPTSQKRKRKSKSDLGLFLENMVMKVMKKQEEMHTQLIETIEKMENERIRREDYWRQVEMERFKRDEALRAQETSRSLALISFLRDLLGEEIRTAEPVSQHHTEANWVETDAQVGTKCDPGNKRWPDAEVRALISFRTSFDHKFRVASSKGSVWEEISYGMSNLGYTRTAKKCKEKWENMNKYFRRLAENGKWRSSDKTCPYIHELDLLYKNGSINQVIGVSGDDEEVKSEIGSGSV